MKNDSLLKLASLYGTPLYVFDEAELQRRMDFLRSNLPSKAEVCYAMKANPFILPRLAHAVDKIEVCSAGEQAICQSLSIDPAKLVISGVSKDEGVIRRAVEVQGTAARYTVESVAQFDMLSRVAKSCNTRLSLLLRVTSGNQFGMDERVVKELASLYGLSPHLDICGIQYYSGTQKRSLGRVEKELAFLSDLVKALRHESGTYIREIEYGPGFPIDYFDGAGQDEAQEREFLQRFSELVSSMRPKRKVVLELGRSLVASCGTYLTSVIDVKCNEGERYAIVDGGMHHLAYYGNSLALKHPPCRLLETAGKGGAADSPEAWNLCGSLCTSNDMLAKRIPLRGLDEGSVLAFGKAGAYCMTEGISLFLSRDLPMVIVVDKAGNCRVARERLPTYPANTPQATAKWTNR